MNLLLGIISVATIVMPLVILVAMDFREALTYEQPSKRRSWACWAAIVLGLVMLLGMVVYN